MSHWRFARRNLECRPKIGAYTIRPPKGCVASPRIRPLRGTMSRAPVQTPRSSGPAGPQARRRVRALIGLEVDCTQLSPIPDGDLQQFLPGRRRPRRRTRSQAIGSRSVDREVPDGDLETERREELSKPVRRHRSHDGAEGRRPASTAGIDQGRRPGDPSSPSIETWANRLSSPATSNESWYNGAR